MGRSLIASTAERLADQYADLLAIGWRRRTNMLVSSAVDFADLEEFDDRLLAALESLLLLGEPSTRRMQVSTPDPLRAGEMFAMTLYALARDDNAMLDGCQALATAIPELRVGIADAFEWAPATPQLRARIEALPSSIRLPLIGVRHRDFDGVAQQALQQLQIIQEPTAAEIIDALQLVRGVGRHDLATDAQRYLEHDVAEVRLAAAQTLLSLAPGGREPAACDALDKLLSDSAPDTRVFVSALRSLALHAPDRAPRYFDRLDEPGLVRLHLMALGWLGRIDAVPALMAHLAAPRTARVAAASISLITGADPVRDDWQGPQMLPDATDRLAGGDIPDVDADAHLPWPDAAAFAAWWHAHGPRFDGTQRYFAGRLISPEWLGEVLICGPLAWRALAAEHLQRLTRGPLFPTRLSAPAQRALFQTLTLKGIA
ncbi:Hypothetical protein bglu_1g23330 [Burkholderia glumae BGR1]|nr:Hypothetical protein bglu_1g23330 [Burkholderia glumae BGR1]KHJ61648.1 hypothetical protein NCPPB3923_17645 [Burkholderia glumae]PJO20708.1 hypothetical protein Y5A_023545 [Burkholderia glumae AU6208]MCR1770937.1 hypothetical protein [Burkholderia glumae]NVE21964.1 hypothetical protein [Burkholderia glumae]